MGDTQSEDPTLTGPDTKDFTPPPPGPTYFTPAKPGPVRTLVDGEFESPAFVKRARLSYGSLFEGGLDIFEEDGGARGRGRKRARFGRPSGAWRYTSQSPSPEREPEPEVSASEQDDEEMAGPAEVMTKPRHEASHAGLPTTESEGLGARSPARPQMTDEACQTSEMDLPTTLPPSAANAADNRGATHSPPSLDAPVAANSQDASLDPSQHPMDFGAWPDDATMAMPPFTDADKFAPGLNPDLQLDAVGGHFHPPWMSNDNYLGNSHNYSEMPAAAVALPPHPGFGSGFASESTSNLAAVRFGFGDSDVRDASLSPHPGSGMDTPGLPQETYPPIGSQDQPSPFVQATTDYPPLDADGHVVLADKAQQPNANPFAAPPMAETTLPSRENALIPHLSHPDTQATLHRVDASVPSWSAADTELCSAPRFSMENSASADGHTPESALVVDRNGDDGEHENGVPGAGVVASLTDRGYDPAAVDSQGDLAEAPLEAEMEVQHSADEQPEYDEDDMGDYDTRQYVGPDDDEDDSHDEDLRPRSLEEPFDDGEDEEEEEEEDDEVDEEEPEDDGEDEYESNEEMSPSPQRPAPSASSAPVVIDLLSSDEEDEDENPPTPLSPKPVRNVQSVPSRPAPVRTSPEYGPESEEDDEMEDEGDDDDQASSDGDDSQVAEDMSESYRDSSGPEDSADDSDGADMVREEAPTTARDTIIVTSAAQVVVEPAGKATGQQEVPQQATSPGIPADAATPASAAADEEVKDVQTQREHHVARSPADKYVELQDSTPIDVVETRVLGHSTAEFERANPPSPTEAETTEQCQENTNIQADEVRVQVDSPVPVRTERVEEDDEMTDAPAAPSSPPFTQSPTSHVVDEKQEIMMEHAPTAGDAEGTEAQLPSPMDAHQPEMLTSHESIARMTISTRENDTLSGAPVEAGSDAIAVHPEESVDHKEKQVLVADVFFQGRRAPSTGEQVMDAALETSITMTAEPPLGTRSEAEEVEAVTDPVSTPFLPQAGAEEDCDVGDSDAASIASQLDHDDALQAFLREEHSKITDADDQEPSLSRVEAPTPSPDAGTAAASSPYGDEAHAQEFQSATSSVHEHAVEGQDSGSEAHDTSTEQPEFSDAMETQEHGEDATSGHGDQPGPPCDAFSDASTSYTSRPPTKPRGSRQKAGTREDTDDDQGEDPSVRLARAAIASRRGTRRRDATPEPPHTFIKTRSSHKSSSPDLGDDSVQIARASLNTPSKLTAKARSTPREASPASPKVDEDTNSVKDVKTMLARHNRDRLPGCTKLAILRQRTGNQSVDVMAVALVTPPEPRRAKGGPREYLMSFTITDYSIGPTSVAEVQISRPHKDSLPKVQEGDIVLLRSFTVVSPRAQGPGLKTGEASSWAVFGKEDEPPQIRGPPVEYGEAECTYAAYLREWFGLLDDKAKAKLSKANQKSIDAGKTK